MELHKEILIGKFLSGNASEEEKEKLTRWINEDAENQKEFDELKKIWNASINLKKEAVADVNQAWEEFKILADSQPVVSKFRMSPLKIAAVIAFFVCTFFLVKFFITDPQNADNTIVVDNSLQEQIKQLDTGTTVEEVQDTTATLQLIKEPVKIRAKSKVKMITLVARDSAVVFLLSDNSKVYLNVNSKITYPEKFVGNERKVVLEGEAYFEVEHDTQNPFIVLCQNSITRVVGTSFNVKGYDKVKEVVVTVLTGLVEVSTNAASSVAAKILLAAGDMGTFYPENNSLLKGKNLKKDKDLKWWKKGFLKNKIKNMFRKLKKRKK